MANIKSILERFQNKWKAASPIQNIDPDKYNEYGAQTSHIASDNANDPSIDIIKFNSDSYVGTKLEDFYERVDSLINWEIDVLEIKINDSPNGSVNKRVFNHKLNQLEILKNDTKRKIEQYLREKLVAKRKEFNTWSTRDALKEFLTTAKDDLKFNFLVEVHKYCAKQEHLMLRSMFLIAESSETNSYKAIVPKLNEKNGKVIKGLYQKELSFNSSQTTSAKVHLFSIERKDEKPLEVYSAAAPASFYTQEQQTILKARTGIDVPSEYSRVSHDENSDYEGMNNCKFVSFGAIESDEFKQGNLLLRSNFQGAEQNPRQPIPKLTRDIAQLVEICAREQLKEMLGDQDIYEIKISSMTLMNVLGVIPNKFDTESKQGDFVNAIHLAIGMVNSQLLTIKDPRSRIEKTITIKPQIDFMAMGLNGKRKELLSSSLQSVINTHAFFDMSCDIEKQLYHALPKLMRKNFPNDLSSLTILIPNYYNYQLLYYQNKQLRVYNAISETTNGIISIKNKLKNAGENKTLQRRLQLAEAGLESLNNIYRALDKQTNDAFKLERYNNKASEILQSQYSELYQKQAQGEKLKQEVNDLEKEVKTLKSHPKNLTMRKTLKTRSKSLKEKKSEYNSFLKQYESLLKKIETTEKNRSNQENRFIDIICRNGWEKTRDSRKILLNELRAYIDNNNTDSQELKDFYNLANNLFELEELWYNKRYYAGNIFSDNAGANGEFQARYMEVAAAQGRFPHFCCFTTEDRSGRLNIKLNAREAFKALHNGLYPRLDNKADQQEMKRLEKIMHDRDTNKRIAGENAPGSEGLQLFPKFTWKDIFSKNLRKMTLVDNCMSDDNNDHLDPKPGYLLSKAEKAPYKFELGSVHRPKMAVIPANSIHCSEELISVVNQHLIQDYSTLKYASGYERANARLDSIQRFNDFLSLYLRPYDTFETQKSIIIGFLLREINIVKKQHASSSPILSFFTGSVLARKYENIVKAIHSDQSLAYSTRCKNDYEDHCRVMNSDKINALYNCQEELLLPKKIDEPKVTLAVSDYAP